MAGQHVAPMYLISGYAQIPDPAQVVLTSGKPQPFGELLARIMTFTLRDTVYDTDTPSAKAAMYADLRAQLQDLVHGESDWIANTANFSSLIFHTMPGLNWAGFYFLKTEDELVLGPFQGKPACIRIKRGRGVCGTTVVKGAPMVVPDVHAFPGHIACDANSRSELVVPVFEAGRLIGVFDLDSPLPGRFDETDAEGIKSLLRILEQTRAG